VRNLQSSRTLVLESHQRAEHFEASDWSYMPLISPGSPNLKNP